MDGRSKLPACIESTQPEDHEWFVCTTGSGPEGNYLLVSCENCGAMGQVSAPTAEEWGRTTGDPYPWTEPWRVVVTSGNLADFKSKDMDAERAREIGAEIATKGTALEEFVAFIRGLVKDGNWSDSPGRFLWAFEAIDAFCEARSQDQKEK
jgi:hypothetical protein